MRLSEVLLRLGCNLVGWLMIYSHLIWLAVIPRIGCGPESQELLRLSLGFSPLVIGASLMLGLARPLTAVVGYLKWLAAPLILLIPLAASPVLTALASATIGESGLCDSLAASGWQRVWAPVQAVTLAVIAVLTIRFVVRRNPVEV